MDKKTRTIIIVGCIITFIIVPAITVLILSNVNQKPKESTPKGDTSEKQTLPNRSNDELTKAITDKHSELTNNGQPSFAIVTVAKPTSGWYVVTIRALDDPQGTNPAKFLLQDTSTTGGGLNALLGPGTSFPSEVTDPIGVPAVVLKELNK